MVLDYPISITTLQFLRSKSNRRHPPAGRTDFLPIVEVDYDYFAYFGASNRSIPIILSVVLELPLLVAA